MQQFTVDEIQRAVAFGGFTDEELNNISEAVSYARSNLQKKNIRWLRIGSTVSWKSPRINAEVQGTVLKIGRKFVTVAEQGVSHQQWRVPANMLEVVK